MPSNSQRKHTISNKVRKRPGKDIDQIHEDLKPNKAAKLLNQELYFQFIACLSSVLSLEQQYRIIEYNPRVLLKASLKIDLDLPGDGQFYCIECERYFIDEKTRTDHRKSKQHKNRVRSLKDVPYSIKEAEAAAGRGHYPHITLKTKISKEDSVSPMQDSAVEDTTT